MLKKLLLCASILFLTGCTINYELEIDKNTIKEKISGTVTKEESDIDKDETGLNIFNTLINFDQSALFDEDDFYNKRVTDSGLNYEYVANYTYKNNFASSNIINSCFENHRIIETEEYYSISLTGNFYCLYSDKININVTSNMAVLEHNAKKVKDNVYTFIIDNSDNVNIVMNISKSIKHLRVEKKSAFSAYQIICFIIFAGLCAAAYIIYKRKRT